MEINPFRSEFVRPQTLFPDFSELRQTNGRRAKAFASAGRYFRRKIVGRTIRSERDRRLRDYRDHKLTPAGYYIS